MRHGLSLIVFLKWIDYSINTYLLEIMKVVSINTYLCEIMKVVSINTYLNEIMKVVTYNSCCSSTINVECIHQVPPHVVQGD